MLSSPPAMALPKPRGHSTPFCRKPVILSQPRIIAENKLVEKPNLSRDKQQTERPWCKFRNRKRRQANQRRAKWWCSLYLDWKEFCEKIYVWAKKSLLVYVADWPCYRDKVIDLKMIKKFLQFLQFFFNNFFFNRFYKKFFTKIFKFLKFYLKI